MSSLLPNEVQGNPATHTTISPALAQNLDTHRTRVELRNNKLQERMALIEDSRLRERLFGVSRRLEALHDRLKGRIAGKLLSEELEY